MKIISSFEKVLSAINEERKKSRFDNGIEPMIKDQDGTIISFENGHVFVCDGEWYVRQYAPKKILFSSPENAKSVLDRIESEETKSTFNEWLQSGMNSNCPISYDLIVSSSIKAECENRIEPDSVNLQIELLGPTEAYISEEYGTGISLTADSKANLAEQIKICILGYLNNEK